MSDAVHMSVAELFDELARRPDIEVVDTRYRGMLAAIRDTLVAEIGLHPWLPSGNSVNASIGGGPFTRLGGDGEIRRYTSGMSPGNVSDADWPRATAIVADLVSQYGFAAPTVVVDRPGDHEVSFPGEYGGELLFGTAVNTTLSLTTGCHLTREAFLRGPSRAEEPSASVEVVPEPSEPVPTPRPARPVVDEDFDQLDFVSPPDIQRRTPEPPPGVPPDPPAAAPRPPEPPRRRRRRDSVEEDFDLMDFVRRKE